jgi:hypothetical protein
VASYRDSFIFFLIFTYISFKNGQLFLSFSTGLLSIRFGTSIIDYRQLYVGGAGGAHACSLFLCRPSEWGSFYS